MSAPFNAGLLLMARQARGLSQIELSTKAGITQGHLSKIENGLSEPAADVVERLSHALDFPASLFQQPDRVYGLPMSVHPMYRKKASVGQRELDRLQAELNFRLLHIRRLLQSAEFEGELPLPAFPADEYGGDGERVAELVRRTWLLPRGPIHNLLECVERAGCVVVLSDFSDAGVDGVTLNTPGLPPCVFLNRNQPSDRIRFTLAHELGHIVMHRIPTPNMEEEANSFASALLMPASDVRPQLCGRLTLERLAALKPVWRVSMAALLYRAKSVGAITENQSRYLWQQISAAKLRLREPPELDFPPEAPSIAPELIRVHLQDLGYTLSDLSRALHLHEGELRRLYQLPNDRRTVLTVIK